jgi:predicted transcriptional regulator of viral defense system
MTQTQQVLHIAAEKGLISGADLKPYGIPGSLLNRLHAEGKLVRVARGIYMLPDRDIDPHLDLAIASKRYPHGVIALLSALAFHGLTTQSPHQVWMAVRYGQMPRLRDRGMRFVTMSGAAFDAGVETHVIEGVPVNLYNAAKTVADCFKFRNRVGLDVALEAYRDFERQGGDMEALWRYAKIDRVDRVMRPYLVGMGA